MSLKLTTDQIIARLSMSYNDIQPLAEISASDLDAAPYCSRVVVLWCDAYVAAVQLVVGVYKATDGQYHRYVEVPNTRQAFRF